MDLNELKLQHIGLKKDEYGKIYTFVDFGNVNRWFDDEVWDWNENKLKENEKLFIDIKKLADFIDIFSSKNFFITDLIIIIRLHCTLMLKHVAIISKLFQNQYNGLSIILLLQRKKLIKRYLNKKQKKIRKEFI
jgi:hypothetical protein